MAWWSPDRISREHLPSNQTATVARWLELTLKQVHLWYCSPGTKATVYHWMHHNSASFESLFLSICPKQGICQQNVCTWFIPFHSDWKYRFDYAISLWQYCPPSHAWYLCDHIHVSSCEYSDMHLADTSSVGHMVSAALMCLDYMHIGIAHALEEFMLMTSFVIKISFIIIELSLIIAFRITEHTHYNENNMAATLEWGMYPFFLTLHQLCTNILDDSHCLPLRWLHALFDRRPATVGPEEAPQSKWISTTWNEHESGLARLDWVFFFFFFCIDTCHQL